jgi:protein-L-isoaspartate(D-aspartate) O-methyltransferase
MVFNIPSQRRTGLVNYEELNDFFQRLDRAFFIDNHYKKCASMDKALPIGYEQTISQPSLVLEMTYLLAPDKECKVLEIGTGSGYQTALLAEFSGQVYTVERIEELAQKSREKLTQLGYDNIAYKIGDGSEGWIENAPYDRIMVTAAAQEIPLELIKQLKAGGAMVIPVGPRGMQELLLITKNQAGEIKRHNVGAVSFVEMKGKYGWREK